MTGHIRLWPASAENPLRHSSFSRNIVRRGGDNKKGQNYISHYNSFHPSSVMASSSSSAVFTEPNPQVSENPGRGLGQKRKYGDVPTGGGVEERKRNCRETDEDLEEIGRGSEVGKPGEGAGRISGWSQDDLLDYLLALSCLCRPNANGITKPRGTSGLFYAMFM